MRFTLQTLFVAIAVGLCSSATAFSADRLPVQLNGDAALSNVGSTAMSESAQACGVVLDTRGCLDPTWSPDGKKIAYLQGKFCCGPADVYVMRTDGSAPKLIAQGQLRCGLDWSPNGRRLVFSAGSTDNPGCHDIYTLGADGLDERQLTNTPQPTGKEPVEVESPQWSPDGKRIAFVRDYDQIYVINADGSGERRIGIGYGPTWSPDGKELALLDLRTEKLTIITPTGRRIRQLRSSSVPLDWSPDGRSILIVRGYIFAIDVATSRAKRLTRSGCDLNPEWSPNGRKIVFLSGRGGSGCDDIPTAVLQIYVMNADGTKQQRLTR